MDYEKKYKEMKARVLEIGRGYVKGVDFSKPRQIAEYIDPELVESEDEKIRQLLVRFVTLHMGDNYSNNISKEECLAWLEKQGEKEKFIEKELGCIRGYREEALRRLQELEKQGEQIPITDFSNLRTWKYIVDVVLTEKEGIGQYLDSPFTEEIAKKLQKRFGNIEQKLTLEDAASAFLQALADTPYNNTPIVEAQAAVKQLLTFLSDPKAYDPNAINEHKSAEWSEEDEQLIDEVVVCLRKYAEKVQGGYSKSYVQSLADRIESLRPGNTCKATGWSEEDEAMFQGVIETEQYMLDVVYGRKIFAVGNEDLKEECTKELAWLKSLRPQKQWKPSTIQSKTIDGIPERDYYKQKKE